MNRRQMNRWHMPGWHMPGWHMPRWHMTERRAHAGFTLLELILVMVIICMVMALAAPTLTGWSRGAKLRNSADEFVSATKFARTRAVSSGYTCVVSIDRQSGTFSVKQQTGQNLTP